MNRHYKRIYCCGDCVYYDWKKHKCKRGAHDEGKAQDHFFADCPLDDFIEEDMSKDEGGDSEKEPQNDYERILKDLKDGKNPSGKYSHFGLKKSMGGG